MRLLLYGAQGRMGQVVLSVLPQYPDIELAAAIDPLNQTADALLTSTSNIDCLLDFSHRSQTTRICDYARQTHTPCVIATTGQNEQELDYIRAASREVPIFISPNMSVGIAILKKCVMIAAQALPAADIEITETHHNRKEDAPSGTALMLADSITKVRKDLYPVFGRHGKNKRAKDEIGIHALRMGNIAGIHEVYFADDHQKITLSHEAYDPSVFADGALKAARFIITQDHGIFDMDDLINAAGWKNA